MELTQELLKDLLHYDPDTGIFTWLKRDRAQFKNNRSFNTWNSRFAGRPTGCKGYGHERLIIRLCKKNYYAHRLAWLYVYGKWPDHEILHDDQNGFNNRILNLSDDLHSKNAKNLKMHCGNKSGFTGVYWNNQRSKWQAFISISGKVTSLGRFSNINDAVKIRQEAEIKHGFHEKHGK